jgi:hypothetical protein
MDAADIVIIGAGAGAKLIWGSVPDRSVAVVEKELAYLFAVLGSQVTVISATPGSSLARSQRRRRRWPSGSPMSVSGCCSATRWRRRSPVRVAPD